ncbi:CBS domain-containing protein [Frigidibacter sp. ROC022]|uniref:CBS domain-containing protein n=1 Tax=Frigidibacter sp. ROC022 TaxID=2971796 RepID=UPI00215A3C60|nr:CBS domain-containing protein [Frigidibacter sp. ROC022]MCR8725243.1 CBS domain-containing protein [Frigidibacter sp. ROC022]
MLVAQILKSKPEAPVVTILPGATVAAAAELLSARRIGAVIVSEDGKRPVGILSERDIVRELGKRGQGCMADLVSALMTRNLVTCTASDAAETVLTQMTEGRFRHMPVMAGEEMTGIISIGDVVKARLAELAMERDALEGMIKGS